MLWKRSGTTKSIGHTTGYGSSRSQFAKQVQKQRRRAGKQKVFHGVLSQRQHLLVSSRLWLANSTDWQMNFSVPEDLCSRLSKTRRALAPDRLTRKEAKKQDPSTVSFEVLHRQLKFKRKFTQQGVCWNYQDDKCKSSSPFCGCRCISS